MLLEVDLLYLRSNSTELALYDIPGSLRHWDSKGGSIPRFLGKQVVKAPSMTALVVFCRTGSGAKHYVLGNQYE